MQVELLTKYECIQKSSPYPIEELPNLSSYLGTHSQQMIHFIHFFFFFLATPKALGLPLKLPATTIQSIRIQYHPKSTHNCMWCNELMK